MRFGDLVHGQQADPRARREIAERVRSDPELRGVAEAELAAMRRRVLSAEGAGLDAPSTKAAPTAAGRPRTVLMRLDAGPRGSFAERFAHLWRELLGALAG